MFSNKKTHLHLRTVLRFAEDLERRAAEVYRDIAARSPNAEVVDVCTFLADQETRHAERIDTIIKRWAGIPASGNDPRTFADDADALAEDFLAPPPETSDILVLLAYAKDQEKKSIRLYEHFQKRLTDEFLSASSAYLAENEAQLEWKLSSLDDMIDEEKRHFKTLTDLMAAIQENESEV